MKTVLKHLSAIALPVCLLVACSEEKRTGPGVDGPQPTPAQSMPSAPAPPSAPSAGAATADGERAVFEGLSYSVPSSWRREQPASSLRLAQYGLAAPGPEAADGQCALFHFPGQGGSVEENITRWLGQFHQPDGSDMASRARRETFSAGGLKITLVDASGTFTDSMGPMAGPAEPKPEYRMLSGIIETPQGPWFIKCTGPVPTMALAAPQVRALLESVEP